MPCYTKQTSTVEFGPQTDVKLLKKALEGMNFRVTETPTGLRFSGWSQDGTFENGKLTLNSSGREDMNVYKRAYSAQVVKAASQRFGWTVKQTDENKFHVQRRA